MINRSAHFCAPSTLLAWVLLAGPTACGPAPEEGSSPPTTTSALSPAPWEPPGLPYFHQAPHARDNGNTSTARLADGYHYAQGELADGLSYSISTYIGGDWTYSATSLWGDDGSAVSSGTDMGVGGEIWNQTGSYQVMSDGTTTGSYFTCFLDVDQTGELYLTEYTAGPEGSSYRSTIDYSDTSASPDCDYLSEWKENLSSTWQMCTREDASWWSCSTSYTSEAQLDARGDTTAMEYLSEQLCDDSRTPFNPDYVYTDEMVWDYASGSYVDVASLTCYETSETRRSFTYVYENGTGTWFDEDGRAVSGPTCGWSA